MKHIVRGLVVIFFVLGAAVFVTAQDMSIQVQTASDGTKYLADSKGMTLYYFTVDTDGQSGCYGPCEQHWPVFYAKDVMVSSDLNAADFGTITRKDGSVVEGYIFDRRSNGRTLADCVVRLFPKDRDEKTSVSYGDIARLEFTGRDTAAGKSFETWVKKYREKKAAGEKNIGLEPEKLD